MLPKLSPLEVVPPRTGSNVPTLGVPSALEQVTDPLTLSSSTFDALGLLYRTMAPGQEISEVVLLADQPGQSADVGDPLVWFEVPGGQILGGNQVLSSKPDGSPALWPAWVVVAVGGVQYDDRGWVDQNHPEVGRTGTRPYLVVRGDSADLFGRVHLSADALGPAGGALDPKRGDRVVLVRCVPTPPVLRWSRDEPGRLRASRTSPAPGLLPGAGPQDLGPHAAGTLYRLVPPPSGWPAGRMLPGDPGIPDSPALLRAGGPGADAVPLGPVLAVPTGTVVQGLDFGSLPVVAAVVEPETGRMMVRPGAVPAGANLWHTALSFLPAGTGQVAPAAGAYFLSPVPERGEVPLLRVGERLPLRTRWVATEAELLATPVPRPGLAVVAGTTGRVLLSPAEAAQLAEGDPLYYLGVFLGEATPALAQQLLPRVGLTRFVPNGSLLKSWAGVVPSLVVPPQTLTDGVGTTSVVMAGGAPLRTTEVDFDASLPPAAPPGTAVFSRQSAQVVLPAGTDPAAPGWVTSSTAILRRFWAGPRLRSMLRHTFTFSGAERLFVAAAPNHFFVWGSGALGKGSFPAEAVAQSLSAAADPAVLRCSVDRGCLVLETSAAWMEVLWGPDPALPDVSGCAALGLCPGWRATQTEGDKYSGPHLVDLAVAVGLPADGVAVARRFSGVVRSPVDPLPVVILGPDKPAQDGPGLSSGTAFWVARGGDSIPVRVGTDVAYDAVGGRLIWAASGGAEVEVRAPVLTVNMGGTLPGTLEINLVPSSGPPVPLRRGVDYELDPAGLSEIRLLQAVGPSQCGGARGILLDNPPRLLDPALDPACVVPGSRIRAGGGWYQVVRSSAGRADLDRAPDPAALGRQGPWVQVAPRTEPLDPSVVADTTLVPIGYRTDYDLRLWLEHAGTSREMAAGMDFVLDPLSGLVALPSPLPPGATLHARMWAADSSGRRTGGIVDAQLVVSNLVVTARKVGLAEYWFGESGPPPAPDQVASVRVVTVSGSAGRPDARVDYPPNLTPAGRVVFPSDLPPPEAQVRVSYASRSAAGGERLVQMPVSPVYASFVPLPAGQPFLGLRGDRTAELRAGQLLRVGSSCFWVSAVQYYPARPGGGDVTRVDILPTPEADAGASGPADAVLLLRSDRSLREDPMAWVPADLVGPLAPGSSQLLLQNVPPEQVVQPGCILEVGGHPYWVASARPGEHLRQIRVGLTSSLLAASVGAPAAARITARPVYPPQPTALVGLRVFSDGPSEVILWPSTGPGRSLVPGTDVRVDPRTGAVQLLGGLVLQPGDRLDVCGQALAVVAPDARGRWPHLRIRLLRQAQPDTQPGDVLMGSYLYIAPDALRFSVEDPPLFRVLSREDRLRLAELDDLAAAQQVSSLLRVSAALSGAVLGPSGRRAGGYDGPLVPPLSEEDEWAVAMRRPVPREPDIEARLVPRRVRTRLTLGSLCGGDPSSGWVVAGRLECSGVLRARAWLPPASVPLLGIQKQVPALVVRQVPQEAALQRPALLRLRDLGVVELRAAGGKVPAKLRAQGDNLLVPDPPAPSAADLWAGSAPLWQIQAHPGDQVVFGSGTALGVGVDLDVDEDGTVLVPRDGRICELPPGSEVEMELWLAAPAVRDLPAAVGEPRDDEGTQEPAAPSAPRAAAQFSEVMRLASAGRSPEKPGGMRVGAGAGILRPGRRVESDHAVLRRLCPGDLLRAGESRGRGGVARVRAVRTDASPVRFWDIAGRGSVVLARYPTLLRADASSVEVQGSAEGFAPAGRAYVVLNAAAVGSADPQMFRTSLLGFGYAGIEPRGDRFRFLGVGEARFADGSPGNLEIVRVGQRIAGATWVALNLDAGEGFGWPGTLRAVRLRCGPGGVQLDMADRQSWVRSAHADGSSCPGGRCPHPGSPVRLDLHLSEAAWRDLNNPHRHGGSAFDARALLPGTEVELEMQPDAGILLDAYGSLDADAAGPFAFGADRVWEHSLEALRPHLLALADPAPGADVSEADLETIGGAAAAEARALLGQVRAGWDELTRAAAGLGGDVPDGVPSPSQVGRLIEKRADHVAAMEAALAQLHRHGGPYRAAVAAALRHRYDPQRGTLQKVRRIREEEP